MEPMNDFDTIIQMVVENNLITIGPPLSGKSTLCNKVRAKGKHSYFSVRSYFEPKRVNSEMKLPSAGTLLPDDMVWEAFEKTVNRQDGPAYFIADGYPATVTQVNMLTDWLNQSNMKGFIIHIRGNKEESQQRMRLRQVCFQCDGGVNGIDINTGDTGFCPICGAKLGKRADDTEIGFMNRWTN